MTKDEMRAGLLRGSILVQEEWAAPEEIRAVGELISEGVTQATKWEWKDNFQCEMRKVEART